MQPRVRFGRVEVDGNYVLLHVTVEVLGLQHSTVVRFTEEKAHQLVGQFHDAVAKLGRLRLGPGGSDGKT
jgi:hypothetical protein